MKKTLELATDFMLVCVLLFAFILPVIVSFNLIPKLYTAPNPNAEVANNNINNVLGVNTLSGSGDFEFVPELVDSKFEKILSNKTVGNAEVIDIELVPEGIVSRRSYVFLGNILNYTDRGTYKISILKNSDMSNNLNVGLKLNETSFSDSEVLVTLTKNQKSSLGVEYSSPVNINYTQSFKIIIEKAD